MLLRKLALAAAVMAPLVVHAAPAAAQSRGMQQAAASTAQAEEVAGWTKNQAAKRPDALPAGVQKVFGDGPLPPGMSRTRSVAPAPSGGSEPPAGDSGSDGEECASEVVFVNGQLMLLDCNGNLVDPLSGG